MGKMDLFIKMLLSSNRKDSRQGKWLFLAYPTAIMRFGLERAGHAELRLSSFLNEIFNVGINFDFGNHHSHLALNYTTTGHSCQETPIMYNKLRKKEKSIKEDIACRLW